MDRRHASSCRLLVCDQYLSVSSQGHKSTERMSQLYSGTSFRDVREVPFSVMSPSRSASAAFDGIHKLHLLDTLVRSMMAILILKIWSTLRESNGTQHRTEYKAKIHRTESPVTSMVALFGMQSSVIGICCDPEKDTLLFDTCGSARPTGRSLLRKHASIPASSSSPQPSFGSGGQRGMSGRRAAGGYILQVYHRSHFLPD
ncbi:hypothetical protein F5883DRAFT_104637 [Diaporthe sp. PMI_573]|nr:hypothetical protein F5883DRAFT_104637 [Diaporthaceae sp. PMI_573]